MMRTVTHRDGMCQRLDVSDLLAPVPLFADIVGDWKVDIVYSDPPWNPGNERYWRRHAGAGEPADYNNLLDAWCTVVSLLRPDHIFCEQSINERHRGLFLRATERCPAWVLPLLEQWTVSYGATRCRRPNVLLHFGTRPLKTDPTGLSGIHMTRCVVGGLDYPPGSVVADPCIGKGMISRLAHEKRWHCAGADLNAKRLGVTIAWLEKRGYV